MNNYNSRDTDAFRGVWVFCEQRDGVIMPTVFELISEGRKLADDLNVELCGLLLGGDDIADISKTLGGYGADRVICCQDSALAVYNTDAYAKVICDVVMEKKPEIFLIGATNIGRDLGPRCAARLHTGLTADCTHLDVDVVKYKEFLKTTSTVNVDKTKFEENTNLKMTRPAFGGHLMATIICPRFRPQMSTVRPGVMQLTDYNPDKAKALVVENYPVSLADDDLRTKVLEVVKEAKAVVELIGAEIIVSVGRGISKNPELGLLLAQELADALGGGVVGASRAVVDAGWTNTDRQVGQTVKTVHPKVYIALGISGAIQHKAGMQDSELIIAVNKNVDAPIFDVADYSICSDLFHIVPLMIEEIKKENIQGVQGI